MTTTTHRYAGDSSTYGVTLERRKGGPTTRTVRVLEVLEGAGSIPIGAVVTVPAARVTPLPVRAMRADALRPGDTLEVHSRRGMRLETVARATVIPACHPMPACVEVAVIGGTSTETFAPSDMVAVR